MKDITLDILDLLELAMGGDMDQDDEFDMDRSADICGLAQRIVSATHGVNSVRCTPTTLKRKGIKILGEEP